MRPIVPRAGSQGGIALVVVLLLLLIVTLVGLAAMRGTLLQERMAGNVAARGAAFQAGEAALREAEAIVADGPDMPDAGEGCRDGLCAMPAPADAPRWESDTFWETAGNTRTSSYQPDGAELRYFVEYMGLGSSTDCTTDIDVSASGGCAANVRNYRITARSELDNGSVVILQSSYQVE